jgi:hypothetical protein
VDTIHRAKRHRIGAESKLESSFQKLPEVVVLEPLCSKSFLVHVSKESPFEEVRLTQKKGVRTAELVQGLVLYQFEVFNGVRDRTSCECLYSYRSRQLPGYALSNRDPCPHGLSQNAWNSLFILKLCTGHPWWAAVRVSLNHPKVVDYDQCHGNQTEDDASQHRSRGSTEK